MVDLGNRWEADEFEGERWAALKRIGSSADGNAQPRNAQKLCEAKGGWGEKQKKQKKTV